MLPLLQPVDSSLRPHTRRPPSCEDIVVIGGGSRPEVGQVSINLPSKGIVCENKVTFFSVDVFPSDDAVPWRIMRRYSEFQSLAALLGNFTTSVQLPPKLLVRCAGSRLEARRQGLERSE